MAGDTIAYVVKLNGITDAKTLSVAGGFSLQFAANLGGLAGVQTTGDIIPLARLVASATFGIDLNPTTSIAAGPAQFTSGPRIDATTTHDGGKALTLDVIRPGVLNQAGTVMILTVNSKSAGTFTLGGVSGISADVDETTLKNDINGISGAYNVNVTKNPQQAGNVYTITFDKAAGPVSAFTFDGSGLQARDEVQQVNVVNTHSGSFTLTFGGQTTDLIAYNADPNSGVNSVQSKLTALSAVGSGNATVAGSAGSYAITFAGTLAGANQGDITADSSQLKGALDDGNLTDAAAFSVSVSNDSAVITAITKDGTSSVSIATTADGGNGLGVNTTTNGAGPSTNEVQTVTVRGSGGTFTLTFGGQTATGLAYNISAGALQSALEGLSSIGTGNVSVTSATTVGGTVYTITFQGTLAHANQAQLVPSAASGITARDELQQLTITGASGGTFALGFDLDTSGSISPSETTAQIAYNASAAAIQSALEGVLGSGNIAVTQPDLSKSVFTLEFQGTRGGANVKPIIVQDVTLLQSQNETQEVALLNATGGTFTLTFDGSTTAGIAYNAPTADVQIALNALSTISAGSGSVSITGTPGNYVVTFDGGARAHTHASKLLGDAGGLENSASFGSLTVSGFTATGDSSAADLVQKLQLALDDASIAGNLTPGLLAAMITNSTFTATGHAVFGGSTNAPNDQAYMIDEHLASSGSGASGTITVPATGGNFTLTLQNTGHTASATTPQLSVGSAPGVLQSSLQSLSTFTGSVTVTQSGNVYTFTFSGGPQIADLSGDLVLTGTAPTANKNATDFASTLQSSIRSTLAGAGISFQPTVTVNGSNELQVNSGSASFSFAPRVPVGRRRLCRRRTRVARLAAGPVHVRRAPGADHAQPAPGREPPVRQPRLPAARARIVAGADRLHEHHDPPDRPDAERQRAADPGLDHVHRDQRGLDHDDRRAHRVPPVEDRQRDQRPVRGHAGLADRRQDARQLLRPGLPAEHQPERDRPLRPRRQPDRVRRRQQDRLGLAGADGDHLVLGRREPDPRRRQPERRRHRARFPRRDGLDASRPGRHVLPRQRQPERRPSRWRSRT